MHVSWGKLCTKRYKKTQKKTTATSKEWEQKQGVRRKSRYCTCPLHTTPAKGWANHLSHPCAQSLDLPLPSPHIKNQLTPTRGVSKGTCYLFSLLPCCSRGPSKALPELLVWSLINFYWLRKAENPGWYQAVCLHLALTSPGYPSRHALYLLQDLRLINFSISLSPVVFVELWLIIQLPTWDSTLHMLI